MVAAVEPHLAGPAEAITPTGINQLVINVHDIEESHRFWTEILGFK
jgi:catechol 2,3-dioxygenase